MPVGTRSSRKRVDEDHVMLSEDGKTPIAHQGDFAQSEGPSDNGSDEDMNSEPSCSASTMSMVWNVLFICSLLFLMLVGIQTFEVCVQKSVSQEVSAEDTRAFVIETILNKLCFTLGPILLFLTITHRYKVSLERGEAESKENAENADDSPK